MSECLCAVVFFLTSIFSITNHSSGEYNSFIVMEYLSHIQQFLQDRCRPFHSVGPAWQVFSFFKGCNL